MDPADAIDFSGPEAWRSWLAEHHDSETEVWVVHQKKASTREGLRYPDGVLEALTYGWIDGKMRSRDKETFVQRYTPRKPGSVWSRNNVDRVEQLIAEGRMTPAGMELVAEAKRRGSWEKAYTDRIPSAMPPDLGHALDSAEGARAEFDALSNSYRNRYIHWVESAKRPQTRERRIAEVVDLALKGRLPFE